MTDDRPRIKLLEWSSPAPPGKDCSYDHVRAETPIGVYSIEWKSWKSNDGYTVHIDGRYIWSEETLDDAKRFAQIAHEKTIKQCLEDRQ